VAGRGELSVLGGVGSGGFGEGGAGVAVAGKAEGEG
jgi:hypothetical protein